MESMKVKKYYVLNESENDREKVLVLEITNSKGKTYKFTPINFVDKKVWEDIIHEDPVVEEFSNFIKNKYTYDIYHNEMVVFINKNYWIVIGGIIKMRYRF